MDGNRTWADKILSGRRADELPVELKSFNPFLASLHQRLDSEHVALAKMHFKPRMLRRQLMLLRLAVQRNWLGTVIWTVAGISLVSSFLVFLLSWPWSAAEGSQSQSASVLACATVVGLGVIVLSAISAPIQKAAEFGPGFTAALLRHPFPWLAGLLIAPAIVFLIWLSTIEPDSEAAFASGLIASFLFASFWISSRFAIGLTDPLRLGTAISKQSIKNIRKLGKAGERFAQLKVGKSAPTSSRETFIDMERAKMAAGGVRHLQQAIAFGVANKRTFEVQVFWKTMVDEVDHFANTYGGAVGAGNGMVDVVAETLPDVVRGLDKAGDRLGAYQVVAYAAKKLTFLQQHADASRARLKMRIAYRNLIKDYWADDESEVPANATIALGGMCVDFIAANAFEDSKYLVQQLFEILELSNQIKRRDIEGAAAEVLVDILAASAFRTHPTHRSSYLRTWTFWAKRRTIDSIVDPDSLVDLPGQYLIPGKNFQSQGIQTVVASVEDDGTFLDLASALNPWLKDILRQVLQMEFEPDFEGGPAVDVLALVSAVLLQGVHLGSNRISAKKVGQSYLSMVIEALGILDPASVRILMGNESFVEMLWSLTLSAAALDDDVEVMEKAASSIRPWLDLITPCNSGYIRRFVAGILLASGQSVVDVDKLIDLLTPSGWGGDEDEGFYIQPLGRANSCNRNRTVHYEQAVDSVNAWALEKFPNFRNAH